MAEGKLNEKANQRFDAAALAAISRVFAREAALKVAEEGLRWVVGAGGVSDAEMAAFETSAGIAGDPPRAGGSDCRHGLRRRRAVRPRGQEAQPSPNRTRAACGQSSSDGPLRLRIEEHHHGRHRLSSDCDRGSGRRSARRPERRRLSGRTSRTAATASARSRRTAGIPALYYDPDHERAGQDVFEDRRLGARVRLGSDEVAAADPAARGRRAWMTAQKWAIACTREALEDYGYPERPLDLDRTAVILGNAMAGEKHYLTVAARLLSGIRPRTGGERQLRRAAGGGAARHHARTARAHRHGAARKSPKTPCPANWPTASPGAIANLFNFHGPNFVCDAACASAMAAISAAVEGLVEHDFDVAVTGGIDRNMGASTFVKFCKIGALSATGTRPYAEGADGFVMGEGAAVFLLKRLADAERDGDKIYAVLRGIGGVERRQGKGHHGAQPGRPEAGDRARLGECRAVARDRDVDRRPRHLHARGRRGGSRRA